MLATDNCTCKKDDCKKCLQILQDKLDKMQEKFDEILNKFEEDNNKLKADIKSLGQYYKKMYPNDPNFYKF